MAILRIENLTKDYVGGWGRRNRALSNLNLEVEAGEIFGFLGPNGAGKTTTIKILLRIIFPTAGTAWILDRKLGEADHQHKIGYMPENPYFYRFLSGREFLLFYARLAGLVGKEARKKADQLLEIVGLSHAAKSRLSEYSKGMVTRVGLAQALITDPILLLLDEPMSGLDPIGRREIRDLIVHLKEEKKTIFFCSHILADVEMLCDRIAILNRGILVKLGTVREILDGGQAQYLLSLNEVPPAAAATLKAMAVKSEEIGGILHLTAPDREKARTMMEQAVREGAQVVEFRADRGTLEDYFVREVGALE